MSKQMISVDRMVLSDEFMVRGIDDSNLMSLENSDPKDWPPLLVSIERDQMGRQTGRYLVLGGAHRLIAAQSLEVDRLPCEVVQDRITETQALLMAYEDNARHGKALTRTERQDYVRLLKQTYPTMSWRELARRTGLSDKTCKTVVEGKAPYERSYDMPGKGVWPYQPSQAQAVVNVLQTILGENTYYSLSSLNSSTIAAIASQLIRGGIEDVPERKRIAKVLSEVSSGLKTASLKISRDKELS